MITNVATVLLVICLIIVLIINVKIYLKRKSAHEYTDLPSYDNSEVGQLSPDTPVNFGFKCMWIAIRTDNKKKVAEMLHLKNISDCNWKKGIIKAYEGSVFITPTIGEWTLACGLGLPSGDNPKRLKEVKKILQSLSKEFGEAQFFCTHRVVEYHCWVKAINGHVVRVYSYLGEACENIAVEGQPTEFEQTLNLVNTFSEEANDENYYEREDLVYVDEELLMRVAGHWSVDPTNLEGRNDIAPGLGLLGTR
jgi:hypothetical protein